MGKPDFLFAHISSVYFCYIAHNKKLMANIGC